MVATPLLGIASATYLFGAVSTHFQYAADLGVFSVLSPFVYVAFLLLFIAFSLYVLGGNYNFALMTAILIGVLFSLLGYLILGPGGSETNYVGAVGYLTATRYVMSSRIGNLIAVSPQYGGWPGPIALYGSLLTVLGVNSSSAVASVLIVSQVALVAFAILLVYVVSRKAFGMSPIASLIATVVFASFEHFVPAVMDDIGLSYILFILTYFLLLKKRTGNEFVSMLPLVAIAVSNFYASLMMMPVVAVYTIATKRVRISLIYLSILTAWLVLYVSPNYTSLANYFAVSVLNFSILFGAVTAATTSGSPAHTIVVLVEIVLYASVVGLAVLRFSFDTLRNGFRAIGPKTLIVSFILSINVTTFLLGPAFGVNPIESLERAAYFVLPLSFMIIFDGFKTRIHLSAALLILVLLLPVLVISLYSPVQTTFVSTGETYSGQFIQSRSVIGQTLFSLAPSYYSAPGVNIYYFTNPAYLYRSNILQISVSEGKPIALGKGLTTVGTQTKVLFQLLSGSSYLYDETVLSLAKSSDVVYSNANVFVFKY